MKFDNDLAAIHGYLCADGYVIRNPQRQKHKYYLIGFRNQNKTLLEDFQKRFERIFSKMPRMRRDGRCVVNSKEIYEKITNNWSFYSSSWAFPDISGQNLRLWLRAFFDCEGWIEVQDRKNRRIGLDSINQAGILQIQEALKSLGIESHLKKNKGKDTFRLQIFGKNNIEKFSKEIGFLHPDKSEKLKEVLGSYPNYIWDLPKSREGLKKFIKRKAKVKKPYIIRIISNKDENTSMLQRILRANFGIESEVYERKSGQGTRYHELSIQKKESVTKALKHGLLNKEQISRMEV